MKSKKHNRNMAILNEDNIRDIVVKMIAIWVFVLPLIVHFKIVDVPVEMQDLYLKERDIDFFAYWKAVWLWIGAGVFFTFAVIFRHVYKISYKLNRFTGTLFVFAVWIIISYIMSPYKNVAWFGYLDRYEGTLSWLSYCMAAYSVNTFVTTRRHKLYIIIGIVSSAGIVGMIGTFQYFGLDFFKTDIAKRLMLGVYYSEYNEALNFTMPVGQSYSTLYNPDYIGTYVTILIPLCVYVINKASHTYVRISAGIIIAFLVLSLFGSQSSAGIITLCVLVVMGIIFMVYLSNISLNIKLFSFLILLMLIIGWFVSPVGIKQLNSFIGNDKNNYTNHFKSVVVDGDNIIVETEDGDIYEIIPNGEIIKVQDKLGNEIEGELQEDRYLVRLPQLSRGSFISLDYSTRIVEFVYYFGLYENNDVSKIKFDYFSQLGFFSVLKRPLNAEKVDVIPLVKNEKIFTGRGYFWNRTLPLVIESPVYGYGMDVFALVYPQIDLLNRAEKYSDHRIIVDKAHNAYMLILINMGFMGLIILMILFFIRIHEYSLYFYFSLVGFILTSFINDSVTTTTLIMFIILSLQRKLID